MADMHAHLELGRMAGLKLVHAAHRLLFGVWAAPTSGCLSSAHAPGRVASHGRVYTGQCTDIQR